MRATATTGTTTATAILPGAERPPEPELFDPPDVARAGSLDFVVDDEDAATVCVTSLDRDAASVAVEVMTRMLGLAEPSLDWEAVIKLVMTAIEGDEDV